MLHMENWLQLFVQKLHEYFGERVWFVGLQGSRGRGEAAAQSDIDVVVILDKLDAEDIQTYHAMLDGMPHRELICGFFSGREELLCWEASDLFQFYHDTTPVIGSLDAILPLLDAEAVNRAIRIGACNIYHGCVHNMLHDHSEELLRGLYKSASFVVQAICFRQTGEYVKHQKDLLTKVAAEDAAVVEIFLSLKQGGNADFQRMSETLFRWAQRWIVQA